MNTKWILNLVITTASFVLISCGGGGSEPVKEEQVQKEVVSEPETSSHELILNIEQDLALSGFTISCPSDTNCNDSDDSEEIVETEDESHADNESDSDDDESENDSDSHANNESDSDDDDDESDNDSESHADNENDDEDNSDSSVTETSSSSDRNYKFENQDVYFYLSLDQAIIDNYSLAAFQENFKYFNFQIFFPERKTDTSTFYFTNASPIETLDEQSVDGLKFTIIDFADNKLKGKVEGTITSITERIESDDQDCMTDDVEGVCFKSETADIPFTINFNLTVE